MGAREKVKQKLGLFELDDQRKPVGSRRILGAGPVRNKQTKKLKYQVGND